MATKRIDLPDDNWAVINDDPLQVHMDRLVEVQMILRDDPTKMYLMSAAAVVAYTESWSLKDDAGEPVPLIEEQVRNRVRSSKIDLLYKAIDAFTAETAPKVPNARAPRPKK